jgi:hypothetical protein
VRGGKRKRGRRRRFQGSAISPGSCRSGRGGQRRRDGVAIVDELLVAGGGEDKIGGD